MGISLHISALHEARNYLTNSSGDHLANTLDHGTDSFGHPLPDLDPHKIGNVNGSDPHIVTVRTQGIFELRSGSY